MAIQNDERYNAVVTALKNGSFADQPEVQAQLANEAALYVQGREQQKVQAFAATVDTTPTTAPTRPAPSPSLPGGIPGRGGQADPDLITLLTNATEAGVDIETGAPASLRAKSDLLALNPQAAHESLEYLVSQELKDAGVELPDGVPAIFKEEFTGQLAYWRPTEQGLKPTLINPPGVDFGDALSALDDTVQLAAEIPAAIGGALAGGAVSGGSPVAAVVGGAAAAGATTAVVNKGRKELARSMGIPDEIVDQITSDDMLFDAAVSAGFEALGPAAVGAIRGLRNLRRPLTDADIPRLKGEFEKTMRAADEIEASTGVRITPSLGGSTGDAAILVAEANAKRSSSGARARTLSENDVRNRAATGDAIRSIHEKRPESSPRLDQDVAELGEQTRGVLAKPLRTAEQKVAQAEEAQLDALDDVASRQYSDRFAGVQDDLAEASSIAKQNEDNVWGTFRKQLELDPQTRRSGIILRNTAPGGVTPINAALAEIRNSSDAALSDSLRKSHISLVEDLGYKETDDFMGNLAAQELDVNQLHKLLSHLKDQARREDAGTGQGWKGNDINTMINAIETQLAEGTFARAGGRQVNPAKAATIRASYQAAKDATITRVGMFREKAVKEILKTDKDGDFIKLPGAVRNLLFTPNDAAPLRDVMDIVGSNPAKRAEMIDELNIMYKQNVLREGKFSKGQSDAFLAAYDDHIRILTGGDSTDFIRNIADFDRMTRKAKGRADQVKNTLSRIYGKKLGGDEVYARNVAADMLDGRLSIDQINAVKNRVGRSNPILWEDIKAKGMEDMQNRLLKAGGKEANSGNLTNLLVEHKGRLNALYGPKYVKDLESMQQVLSAVDGSKLAKVARENINPAWLQATRTLFGPLSVIQRRITASTKLIKAQRDKGLFELLTDPNRLENFVKLQRLRPGTIGYIQAWQNAGLSASQLDSASQEKIQMLEDVQRRGGGSPIVRQLREINEQRRSVNDR